MKKYLLCLIVLSGIFAGVIQSEQTQAPVGYSALSAIDHLWLFTGKAQTAMFSSSDPSGGNMDMKNFHGKFQGEKILANIKGPGCVYRIWSAMPSGRIKVYLDGSKKPEIDCEFKAYLEGRCQGLPGDFSVGRTANYMPICFAKSIIITAPGFSFPAYYQVSYQTYDPSVQLKSFRKTDALSDPELKSAIALWKSNALSGIDHTNFQKTSIRIVLEPNKDTLALELKGAGIIRKLSIHDAQNPEDPLEDVELKIFWDDSKEPAVNSPVSAFFANYPDLKDKWQGSSLKNIFLSADANGYSCYFPMPFSKSASIALKNAGPTRSLEIEVWTEKRDSLPENAMRFHAWFKSQEYPTLATPENTITMKTPIDPATNYVVLDIKGKGHYIGCALFVKSVGTLWWGEGDEMTYIDGSETPQIRGTGTEDEFNWSWGFSPGNMNPISGVLPVVPECKESIVAQIIPPLGNPDCQKIEGNNIAYRFRLSDYVPFRDSIKVSYERLGAVWYTPHFYLYPGNQSQFRGDDFASVAYWYQLP